MARKTCDFRLALEARRVQLDDHLHHVARTTLWKLVVAIPHPAAQVRWSPREIRSGLNVTVIAPDTERLPDEVHQRKQLRLGQGLQHLELRPFLTGSAGLL